MEDAEKLRHLEVQTTIEQIRMVRSQFRTTEALVLTAAVVVPVLLVAGLWLVIVLT